MKSVILWPLLLALFTACSTSSKSGSGRAPAFTIRHFESQTLKNGLTVLWVPDAGLPYLTMTMMVKAGSSQDPEGKEGLAGFTAAMLEKGTHRRSAPRIAEDLEQNGTEFGVNVDPDYTMVSISALSFHKEQALKDFAEILLQPSFPQGEIERHRKNVLAGLRKLPDQARGFANYLAPAFIFGKHPYGHSVSGVPRSVRAIRKADLQIFYNQNYAPANAVLAVVGKYDDAWKESLVRTLEGWRVRRNPSKDLPGFPHWQGRELMLVNRPDLNQAQIQIGFKGVPRNIPDYMELRAALKILGEGSGSRLYDEVRDKAGLTYHIHAWHDPRVQTGPMGIYTFTRTDRIGETVSATLKVYEDFVKNGVSSREVEEVKGLMKGQFPRSFETPEALAQQLLILSRYNVSTDYLTNYLKNLNELSRDRINETIRKYFTADNLRILVYAPKGKAEEPLKKFGKLEIREYKEFLQ